MRNKATSKEKWPRIAVCSWSLRPASARNLAERVRAVGVGAVQLALDPIRRGEKGWGEIETMHALRGGGITIVSGMMGMRGEDYSTLETIKRTGGVRMDATWEENLAAARANARLARRLGISLVTFHAGFIPHEQGHERKTMLSRLRTLIDAFDECGVRVGFETGQETAETFLAALDELDAMGGEGAKAGVNFDPANMILYGMGDPVAAAARLAGRIVQVHVKDAKATERTGTWGSEVRAGTGDVVWRAFFGALREGGVVCELVIEREAGEKRDVDVVAARKLIEKFVVPSPRGASLGRSVKAARGDASAARKSASGKKRGRTQ